MAKTKKTVRHRLETLRFEVVPSSPATDPIVCSFPGGLPLALAKTTAATTRPDSDHDDEANDDDDDNNNGLLVASPKFVLRREKPNATVEKFERVLVGRDDACLYRASMKERDTPGSTTANKKEKNSKKRKSSSSLPEPDDKTAFATATQSRTRLCVGVYDKETNTLTLHSTAQDGVVWALQQSVPSYTPQIPERVQANSLELVQSLYADFGSIKKQRAMKSRLANRVSDTSQVVGTAGTMARIVQRQQQQPDDEEAAAAAAAAPAQATDAAEAATQEWRRQFLPRKYCITAVQPSQAYPPKHMAGQEAWQQLTKQVEECWKKDDPVAALTQDWQDATAYLDRKAKPSQKGITHRVGKSAIVFESLCRLANRIGHMKREDAIRKEQLRCALLLHSWCKLYRFWEHRRFFPKPIRYLMNIHVSIQLAFVDNFGTVIVDPETGKSGYCMSKANKDRCLLHLGLLFLMAEDLRGCRSNFLTDLAKDLQVDVNAIVHVLRQAGCSVRKDGNSCTAYLAMPLSLPTALKKRGAKKAVR